MSRRRVFSTFLECSEMSGVFFHRVTHAYYMCRLLHLLYEIDSTHAKQ